jgi:hypothetical protein
MANLLELSMRSKRRVLRGMTCLDERGFLFEVAATQIGSRYLYGGRIDLAFAIPQ